MPVPISGEKTPNRIFIPVLALAYSATNISNIIISLLAVDMAKTFLGSSSGVSIGFTSQLNTINSTATVAFAIILSALSIRISKYKPLFLVGIIFVLISAAGSFLSSSLLSLQIFYAIEGAGSIIVWIMATTIIGNVLPPEKKAKAISYLISMGAVTSLVTIFLVGYVTSAGGWKESFLVLVVPFSALALMVTLFALPSELEKDNFSQKKPGINGFRKILSNKSVIACLAVELLTVAPGQIAIFSIAFYRTRFALPVEWATAIIEIATSIFIIAPLISGRMVNRVGAKRLTILNLSLVAGCQLILFFMPNIYAAVTVDMLMVIFGTATIPAFVYLKLEQVPNNRGAMMSLNSLFSNIGSAIVPAIGGATLVLTFGRYEALGIVFGVMGFIAVVVLAFLVKDTTKE